MFAVDLIEQLYLKPHPEGGYYRETYRSEGSIDADALPSQFGGNRSYATAIYFLLQQGDYSAFHRIRSDECWHHYEGETLHIHVIHTSGWYELIQLGKNISAGEVYQAVVPAGAWFASEPDNGAGYVLVGCTVSPGFDFRDFEMASVDVLEQTFPHHQALIRRLCR